MTTKQRTDLLTTVELYNLDAACQIIRKAFGHPPYLVGSAGFGDGSTYRDVDVRLMLSAEEFEAACPTRDRWEALCLAFGAYLRERTGLPVDFQLQHQDIANEKFPARRNPLGMGRTFAGGGDATPNWEEPA